MIDGTDVLYVDKIGGIAACARRAIVGPHARPRRVLASALSASPPSVVAQVPRCRCVVSRSAIVVPNVLLDDLARSAKRGLRSTAGIRRMAASPPRSSCVGGRSARSPSQGPAVASIRIGWHLRFARRRSESGACSTPRTTISTRRADVRSSSRHRTCAGGGVPLTRTRSLRRVVGPADTRLPAGARRRGTVSATISAPPLAERCSDPLLLSAHHETRLMPGGNDHV